VDYRISLIDALTAPARAASASVVALDKSMSSASKAATSMQSSINSVGKSIKGGLSGVASTVGAKLNSVFGPAIGRMKEVGAAVAAPYRKAGADVAALGGRVKDAVVGSKAFGVAAAVVGKVGSAAKSVAGAIGSAGSAIGGLGRQAANSAGGGIGALLGKLKLVGPLAVAALAAAGVAGLAAGAKMALGVKGTAAMAQISAKASMDIKRLFSGIDSKPFTDGLRRITQNFGQNTVAGKALKGVVNGIFTGLFETLGKIAPYAEIAFLYLVLGTLKVRNAFLKLKLFFLEVADTVREKWDTVKEPLEGLKKSAAALWDNIKDLGGGFEGAGTSASDLGNAIVTVLGVGFTMLSTILGVVGPLIRSIGNIVGGVVKTVVSAINGDWKGAWDGFKQIIVGVIDASVDVVLGGIEIILKGVDKVASIFGKPLDTAGWMADLRKDLKMEVHDALGTDTKGRTKKVGEDIGDGVKLGLEKKEGAIYEAGKKAAKAAVDGMKEGADTHSPSRKTAWVGSMMGQGVVVGMRSETANIDAAARNYLVPDLPGVASSAMGSAGAMGSSGNSKVVYVQAGAIVINATGGDAASLEMAVRSALDNYADDTATAMGAQ